MFHFSVCVFLQSASSNFPLSLKQTTHARFFASADVVAPGRNWQSERSTANETASSSSCSIALDIRRRRHNLISRSPHSRCPLFAKLQWPQSRFLLLLLPPLWRKTRRCVCLQEFLERGGEKRGVKEKSVRVGVSRNLASTSTQPSLSSSFDNHQTTAVHNRRLGPRRRGPRRDGGERRAFSFFALRRVERRMENQHSKRKKLKKKTLSSSSAATTPFLPPATLLSPWEPPSSSAHATTP